MRHDEFARHETDARDLIEALGKLSHDHRASVDFEGQVMALTDAEPAPRRGLWAWFLDAPWVPTSPAMRMAVVGLSLVILIGAVSQYMTWVNAYWMGIPSDGLREARLQEHLWQKNFNCATQLDHKSVNYAAIASEQVTVVTWACPSGDVLVTLESVADEISRRSVWVPLDTPAEAAGLLEGLIPSAFAASPELLIAQRQKPKMSVLCQKWLSKQRLQRRVQRAPGKCVDEVIDTRNGKVIERRPAPCEPC